MVVNYIKNNDNSFVSIDIPCILVNIEKSNYGSTSMDLNNLFHYSFPLGIDKEKAQYILAVNKSIVQEVYTIDKWIRDIKSTNNNNKDIAWNFIGNIANESIRNKYLFKNVSNYQLPHQSICYVNIKKSEYRQL